MSFEATKTTKLAKAKATSNFFDFIPGNDLLIKEVTSD